MRGRNGGSPIVASAARHSAQRCCRQACLRKSCEECGEDQAGQKYLRDKDVPWVKLANEKPKGETIAYDTMLNASKPASPAEPPRQWRRARLRTIGKTRVLGCALYKLSAQSLQP